MAKKLLLLFSLILTVLVPLSTHTVFANPLVSSEVEPEIFVGDYQQKLEEWNNTNLLNTSSFKKKIIAKDIFGGSLVLKEDSFDYEEDVVLVQTDETITFTLDINLTGLYQMAIDFYSLSDDYLDMELAVKVNGSLLYDEAGQIVVYKHWKQSDGFSLDRYGNDFYGEQIQENKWIHQDFYDPMGLFLEPLAFYLEEGSQEISFTVIKGKMLIGNIDISGRKALISYEDYSDTAELIEDEILIENEAEIPDYKNAASIQAGVSRSVGVTPFSVKYLKLNTISGGSYNSQREMVAYRVEVEKEGYYYLTFKAKQSNNVNSAVFRTLRINGEIPFEEAAYIKFEYDNSWQNITLGDGENPYLFYLSKGVNELSLSVNLSPYQEAYYEIEDILEYVNDLSLNVKKLTGNQLDEFRDWKILDYLPNVVDELELAAKNLEDIYDELNALTSSKKLSEAASMIKIAIRNLKILSEEPNEIPKNINLLSTSQESIASTLRSAVSLLLNSPLDLDKFYIHTEVKLENANGNFFESLWVSIKRFFLSFFDERYQVNPDDDELVVWVNRSKQYTDLMQKMADDGFTKNTGVKVQISVMASEGKLILANSAGTNPDVAMGIASWLPYDLGIRGAILDLTEFIDDEDFSTVLNQYYNQALIPLMYDDGLYGLPDTENFYVLYYRHDILDALNIQVPNTWDDVKEIMPVLKRYGMNFYLPLSSATSLKSFDSTLPFLFQFGSSVYDRSGFNVDLENTEAINALEVMTELYTIYSIDTTVTSFYNDFRLGLSPIGIGDFGMYTTLLNAANDIKGLWSIALLPGVENENKEIDRSAPGALTSNMIFKNTDKKTESWEFLKWWSSTETQVRFQDLLLSTLGPEYLWNSGNVDAFSALNINQDDLNIILEQWTHLKELPKVPGSYQVELEISNIWNAVVLNRENMRVLLNDAIIRMNNEIHRKMAEFSYMDKEGNILKEYSLAEESIIVQWKASDEDE
ncbi:MAG: extracellular solute-binding protein [Candidatus Izemoplasmatales bacterium]|nr:extracellular solute-binding protein [Candidatus Izemoplasmatales bacterium]